MIEPSIIRKLETVFGDTIKEAKRQGIEADIRSGWYSVPEICARWKVGAAKVVAIRKQIGKGTK